MGYSIEKLKRPYDYKVLVEAYVRTQREDYVHPDFAAYYQSLCAVLEKQFEVRFSAEYFSDSKAALWMLFESTVGSLLRITTPWDAFLEETLIVSTLQKSGNAGKRIDQASQTILQATRESRQAHLEILHELFALMYSKTDVIITSEQLALVGFDDSQEPDIRDYYDDF
ncbi:MAG: hypothetical protein HY774_25695 [Acidobacteria bacterium]|nr:hypothetical protein [Acidobacteriota bacterium]